MHVVVMSSSCRYAATAWDRVRQHSNQRCISTSAVFIPVQALPGTQPMPPPLPPPTSIPLPFFHQEVESPVAYGLGALEDLLPQVPDLAPSDTHPLTSALPHSTSLGASHGHSSGLGGGLGRLATGVVGGSVLGGTSQYPLMEESALPDTQLMPEASVTRHTMLVLQ
jgi:hypothetical protein